MATENNRQHINSFTKGMNSDTSYDMLESNQYTYGENIRITNNTNIGVPSTSNSTEGIVSPLPGGVTVDEEALDFGEVNPTIKSVLGFKSLGDIGALVVAYTIPNSTTENPDGVKNKWALFKLVMNLSIDEVSASLVFKTEYTHNRDKFSLLLNKETDNILNLYIADGENPIMSFNLLDNSDYYSRITDINQLMTNRYFPTNKVWIDKIIDGTLTTGQVLYTYRLYHKNGVRTRLAPLTNKIQVIDKYRNKEIGNAADTQTSIGFQLRVPLESGINEIYDYIQLYRITYKKPHTDPDVLLILDTLLQSGGEFIINDTGLQSLLDLSVEEFASLDTLDITPQYIELNQGYLFAANIKDETNEKFNPELLLNYDTRSYSFDVNLHTKLYSNDNTTYEETEGKVKEFVISNPGTLFTKENKYDLNKGSDLNHPAGDYRFIYDEDKYINVYGGHGANIDWKLICVQVPLDDNTYSKDIPVSEYNFLNDNFFYVDSENNLVPNKNRSMFVKNLNEEILGPYIRNRRFDRPFTSDGSTKMYYCWTRNQGTSEVACYVEREMPVDEDRVYGQYQPGRIVEFGKVDLIYSQRPYCVKDLIYDLNVNIDESTGYSDIISSSLLRSLKRDEVYRYGIVLYDKYGNHSDVKWIADIKTPSASELPINQIVEYIETIEVGPSPATITAYITQSLETNIYTRGPRDLDIEYNNTTFSNWYNEQSDTHRIYTIPDYTEAQTCYIWYGDNMVQVGDVLGYTDPKEASIAYVLRFSQNANVLGIKFDVTLPEGCDGYQIVRCEKQQLYTKNILQCCTSRPIKLQLYSSNASVSKYSPYYPLPLINNVNTQISSGPYDVTFSSPSNKDQKNIFQLFCPEFLFKQSDYEHIIGNNILKLLPIYFSYEKNNTSDNQIGYSVDHINNYIKSRNVKNNTPILYIDDGIIFKKHFTEGAFKRMSGPNNGSYTEYTDKTESSYVFKFNQNYLIPSDVSSENANIKYISNAQNINWEQGFGNMQPVGQDILSGTKQYKSYISQIGDSQYNNWISNAMYDLALSKSITEPGISTDGGGINRVFIEGDDTRNYRAAGWIGPGPRCFVAKILSDETSAFQYNTCIRILEGNVTHPYLHTLITNIIHSASQFSGLSDLEKQYDIYYGFGNFSTESTKFVFDGDTYIVPCEITSMYKSYDFHSKDTLPSTLIVNYVTMESSINTYFDYGMSYRNTQSKNLMLEPGEITGVATQERPEHQYNDIYSDNNISCDIFNAQSLEDTVDTYPQRIFYSQHKLNGERIDSWLDFKSTDYIDVDTRYDAITNLLQSKNILYFWLNSAFGKLSVNERSLITDESNNKISLGEGGVLQRSDYIDTKYGMRKDDFSALGVGPGVYWIDIMNKAIVMSDGNNVINYSERVNVLNIINSDISANIPQISYDLQNDELICKCLNSGKQLVFNLKLNVATSVYTREYLEMLLFNNVLYGLALNELLIDLTQYNYIRDAISYLNTVLSFVVNPGSSETKVYDNQQIVTLYRKDSVREETDTYWHNKKLRFETDILKEEDTINYSIDCTEREGNIRYAIPRYGNENFGNRWRGKWLKVLINADYQSDENYNPYEDSISHIITSYRKSFS